MKETTVSVKSYTLGNIADITITENQLIFVTQENISLVKKILKDDQLTEYYICMLREFDQNTYQHSINVAALSSKIGQEIFLNEKDQRELCISALLHDIGKMFIPQEILNKKGKLSEKDMQYIKMHPQIGYNLLKFQKSYSNKILGGVLTHHEQYAGIGYGNRLKGINIPLFGRVITIADVYDAITSERPYKKKIEFRDALDMMHEEHLMRYDPELYEVFQRMAKKAANSNYHK